MLRCCYSNTFSVNKAYERIPNCYSKAGIGLRLLQMDICQLLFDFPGLVAAFRDICLNLNCIVYVLFSLFSHMVHRAFCFGEEKLLYPHVFVHLVGQTIINNILLSFKKKSKYSLNVYLSSVTCFECIYDDVHIFFKFLLYMFSL